MSLETVNLTLRYLFTNNTNSKMFRVLVPKIELAHGDDISEARRNFIMHKWALRDTSNPFSLSNNIFF